jgi:hypothetical protein
VLACRDAGGAAYAVDSGAGAEAGGWSQVSDGNGAFGCAIRGNGSLACWGSSVATTRAGQTINRAVPVAVAPGTTWLRVSASSGAACGIRSDRTLWCWSRGTGPNDGTLGSAPTPRQIGADADWEAVGAAYYQTCGIRAGGRVHCIYPDYPNKAPVTVPGEGWVAVTTAGPAGLSCAIDAAGALACWTDAAATLVTMAPAAGWVEARASGSHVCARRQDGTRWCWGDNEAGQLGDGTAWRTVPVPVVR